MLALHVVTLLACITSAIERAQGARVTRQSEMDCPNSFPIEDVVNDPTPINGFCGFSNYIPYPVNAVGATFRTLDSETCDGIDNVTNILSIELPAESLAERHVISGPGQTATLSAASSKVDRSKVSLFAGVFEGVDVCGRIDFWKAQISFRF
ncbi:hypothetical protein BT69DRAFT_1293715 [Atractiella rhizophila]|nr:hypothetical protein BT69DRAFT_1293715 [Atractiella rhizophila]